MEPTNNLTPSNDGVPSMEPEMPMQPAMEPMPGVPIAESATMPTQSATVAQPIAPAQPVNPVIQPGGGNPFAAMGGGLVAATDPITMPTPPKAPDPVEQELKAPFRAADPVPGSIGSAISVPAEATQGAVSPASQPMNHANNVAFNDPAMQSAENPSGGQPAKSGKKQLNKNTMIILSVVAVLIIAVLVVVLVMSL